MDLLFNWNEVSGPSWGAAGTPRVKSLFLYYEWVFSYSMNSPWKRIKLNLGGGELSTDTINGRQKSNRFTSRSFWYFIGAGWWRCVYPTPKVLKSDPLCFLGGHKMIGIDPLLFLWPIYDLWLETEIPHLNWAVHAGKIGTKYFNLYNQAFNFWCFRSLTGPELQYSRKGVCLASDQWNSIPSTQHGLPEPVRSESWMYRQG